MYGCWLRCAGALRQLSGHTFVAWHGAGAVLGIAQSGSGAPPVHSPYHWHTVHWCWSTGHLLMSEYVKTIIIDSVIIVTGRKWWFDALIHLMVNNETMWIDFASCVYSCLLVHGCHLWTYMICNFPSEGIVKASVEIASGQCHCLFFCVCLKQGKTKNQI